MGLTPDQIKEKNYRKAYTRLNKGEFGEGITPSDRNNLPETNAQLFIGTGGNIKVTLSGGNIVTFKNISSGTYLSGIYIDKVHSTGTTVSDIIAIY